MSEIKYKSGLKTKPMQPPLSPPKYPRSSQRNAPSPQQHVLFRCYYNLFGVIRCCFLCFFSCQIKIHSVYIQRVGCRWDYNIEKLQQNIWISVSMFISCGKQGTIHKTGLHYSVPLFRFPTSHYFKLFCLTHTKGGWKMQYHSTRNHFLFPFVSWDTLTVIHEHWSRT